MRKKIEEILERVHRLMWDRLINNEPSKDSLTKKEAVDQILTEVTEWAEGIVGEDENLYIASIPYEHNAKKIRNQLRAELRERIKKL